MQRMQLTTTCQLCGTAYDRAGDLVAHLIQSHGADWQMSQSLLRFLIQTIQSKHGCQCNPSPNEAATAHVCVSLRQIAMIFQHCQIDMLVPTQFEDTSTALRFSFLEGEPTLPKLTKTLIERQFSQLWTSPELLHVLRNRCMLCGGYYQPAVLMAHLRTMHADICGWAAQILFQILPSMKGLQIHDFQCSCCSLVFNLPPSSQDQAGSRAPWPAAASSL